MNMTPKMEEEVLAVLRQPMDDVVGVGLPCAGSHFNSFNMDCDNNIYKFLDTIHNHIFYILF